ncbi:TerC family protein [Aneurinibacillus migulanus]|uniref:Membrane protein n=1 Tax=Aneurinibacillus migulanus TaxID=47500 RepID=A0A0D1V6P6_ANEMI|nr:TerC family protein [Aneurinibacillus migulanus]KIV55009.1 membrane protein [Aneurinibacillus migulanus]KON94464.1 membrane protein [Aneurinibacillus migulanus]MED0893133.1 TerC family protein [Aneurinibacillus migulanus]MED1619746.1 TerC family protein [Aneurinibacillus migulanus]SDK41585.1 integral membrane protein, YjbE family [Aneurinibacillus migulanus]
MEWLIVLLQIILINLVLSGDNAVVIALACRKLPEEHRKKAVLIGTVGAIVLRIILTLIAAYLLRVPFIEMVGGLLLLWIAIKLLRNDEEKTDIKQGASLWAAVKTIIVADFVMGLDNVLGVAGAAGGNIYLLIAGLALSIPIIVWGSTLIMSLMERFSWLIMLGAAVLGWTAGEMVTNDVFVHRMIQNNDVAELAIPFVAVIVVLVAGRMGGKLETR